MRTRIILLFNPASYKSDQRCIMKRLTSFVFFLFTVSQFQVFALDWYFSTEQSAEQGSSSISGIKGQSPGFPLIGLEALNKKLEAAKSGDRFYLERGDRFTGAIRCPAKGDGTSPIIISAFGNGQNPVITDLVRVSKWTKIGTKLWITKLITQLNYKNFELSMLLEAGKQLPLGRYPNANASWGGFLVIGKHEGKTRILPPGLPDTPNWEGGEVVMRSNNWVLDRLRIKSHAAGTLTFTSESSYEPGDGYGFFIQNHQAALDTEGEWCHDRVKGEIVLYSDSDPNQKIYEYTSQPVLIDLKNSAYISLEGLDFMGGNECMVALDGSTGCSIRSCGFRLAGRNVVNGKAFIKDFTFAANTVADTQNNVITIELAKNVKLMDNQILRTALTAGMGKHGDDQYDVMWVDADNLTIERNRIEQSGYMPIYFKGNDVMVRHNIIDGYATVKDDVGGIYTWNDGRRIFRNRIVSQNLVCNGIGAPNGKPQTERILVEGIYMDDRVNDVRIENNIVYNISDAGVYIHNAHEVIVKDNIFFDNGVGMLFSHDGIAKEHDIRAVKIIGNIVFSANANQEMVRIGNWVDAIEPGIEFTGNIYSSPFRKTAQFSISLNGKLPSVFDLSQWIAPAGRDPSGIGGKRFIETTKVEWTGPDNIKNGNFTSGLFDWGWWSMYGKGKAESKQAIFTVEKAGDKTSTTVPVARLYFSEALKKDDSNLSFWSLPYQSTKGKQYRLRFKARSSIDGTKLSFLTRRNADPWNWVSDEVFYTLDREMRDYQLVFTPKNDEPNSRTEFNIYEKGMPVTENMADAYVEITAVELKEIKLGEIDPKTFYIFEPNFNGVEKEISLQGAWIDLRQKPVSGKVKIAPYSAGIFLKAE
jgi:parallel beta-helix repeat protein